MHYTLIKCINGWFIYFIKMDFSYIKNDLSEENLRIPCYKLEVAATMHKRWIGA